MTAIIYVVVVVVVVIVVSVFFNYLSISPEVNSIIYLRTIMNADNLIEEEIKERIAADNRSFFGKKKDIPKQTNN